jgi:hypothetical protein
MTALQTCIESAQCLWALSMESRRKLTSDVVAAADLIEVDTAIRRGTLLRDCLDELERLLVSSLL